MNFHRKFNFFAWFASPFSIGPKDTTQLKNLKMFDSSITVKSYLHLASTIYIL